VNILTQIQRSRTGFNEQTCYFFKPNGGLFRPQFGTVQNWHFLGRMGLSQLA
jgi:hypothetical protein